jgi:hypothetical protein
MKRFLLCMFLTMATMSVAFAQSVTTAETSTGFFYPLGTASYATAPLDCGTWLARDSANGGCYISGDYHIGFDFFFPSGSPDAYGYPAFTVATGTVKYISTSGWTSGGTTNVGVALQHTTTDGTTYYSIYGHLLNTSVVVSVGDIVSGGTQVGTIGTWSGGDHVHLGIFPTTGSMPASNWGLMPDSSWASQNGAVDPVAFIQSKTPTCQNGSTQHYTPGGSHAVHPNNSILVYSGTYYVLVSGALRGIPSRTMLNTLYGTGRGFDFRDGITISSAEFSSYSTGATVTSSLTDNGKSQPDGRIIQQSGSGTLYIVTNSGHIRAFASATAFLNLGYQFCNIATVADITNYPSDPAGNITQ